MKIFITADTHFGHRTLATKLAVWPADFEERIVRHWERMISVDDLVIHLGDVVVGRSSDWMSTVAGLPGRRVLVLGNHDRKTHRWYMTNGFDFCCERFWWKMFGLEILFTHEPRLDEMFDLNIHGHLHEGRHRELPTDDRHVLFSLEATGYEPRTLDSIVREWEETPPQAHEL